MREEYNEKTQTWVIWITSYDLWEKAVEYMEQHKDRFRGMVEIEVILK